MIDIDDFKLVNDHHSHLAGDFILKAFSDLARKAVRKEDIVCRYGGDEFTIIFGGCSLEVATKVMERLRETIESRDFTFAGQSIRITMSGGLYQMRQGDTVKDALKMVDQQLYRSKEIGKNTVSVFRP